MRPFHGSSLIHLNKGIKYVKIEFLVNRPLKKVGLVF